MKVIVIEFNGTEHELEMAPPFSSIWIDKSDAQNPRYFLSCAWRNYTTPVFKEVIPTEFTLT